MRGSLWSSTIAPGVVERFLFANRHPFGEREQLGMGDVDPFLDKGADLFAFPAELRCLASKHLGIQWVCQLPEHAVDRLPDIDFVDWIPVSVSQSNAPGSLPE